MGNPEACVHPGRRLIHKKNMDAVLHIHSVFFFFLISLNEQTAYMESKHVMQHRKASTVKILIRPIYSKNIENKDSNSNF